MALDEVFYREMSSLRDGLPTRLGGASCVISYHCLLFLYQPSQPAPLGAGSPPSRFVPGATIAGSIFRILRRSLCVLAQSCACMNTPLPCLNKASGSSVRMRKPRSRRERQSKLLVQPSTSIRCISLHATIGVALCI